MLPFAHRDSNSAAQSWREIVVRWTARRSLFCESLEARCLRSSTPWDEAFVSATYPATAMTPHSIPIVRTEDVRSAERLDGSSLMATSNPENPAPFVGVARATSCATHFAPFQPARSSDGASYADSPNAILARTIFDRWTNPSSATIPPFAEPQSAPPTPIVSSPSLPVVVMVESVKTNLDVFHSAILDTSSPISFIVFASHGAGSGSVTGTICCAAGTSAHPLSDVRTGDAPLHVSSVSSHVPNLILQHDAITPSIVASAIVGISSGQWSASDTHERWMRDGLTNSYQQPSMNSSEAARERDGNGPGKSTSRYGGFVQLDRRSWLESDDASRVTNGDSSSRAEQNGTDDSLWFDDWLSLDNLTRETLPNEQWAATNDETTDGKIDTFDRCNALLDDAELNAIAGDVLARAADSEPTNTEVEPRGMIWLSNEQTPDGGAHQIVLKESNLTADGHSLATSELSEIRRSIGDNSATIGNSQAFDVQLGEIPATRLGEQESSTEIASETSDPDAVSSVSAATFGLPLGLFGMAIRRKPSVPRNATQASRRLRPK